MAALRRHQAGDLDAARRGYEEVLRHQPRHADALHLLGVSELQAGRPQAGLARIEAALAINRSVAAYHDNHGSALRVLGRFGEAVAAHRRALGLDAGLPAPCFNLAVALAALGRSGEAAVAYRRALALDPALAPVCHGLGSALAALGRWEEAAAAFARALNLLPGFADAAADRGAALIQLGRPAEALEPLARALALRPDLAGAHNATGHALHGLGIVERAARAYRRAVALAPGFADALNNLGTLEKERGATDAAAALFRAALRVDPAHAAAHGNAANLHLAQGAVAPALRRLERVLALDPVNGPALAEVCRAAMALGRADRAAHAARWLKTVSAAGVRLLEAPMAALADLPVERARGLNPATLIRALLDTGLERPTLDPYDRRALTLGGWFTGHYGCPPPPDMARDGLAVFARAREEYRGVLPEAPPLRLRSGVRRVAFVTNQLLALLHSPTRLLLQWVKLAVGHAGVEALAVALGDPRSRGFAAEHRAALDGAAADFLYADMDRPAADRDRLVLEGMAAFDPDLVVVLSDDTLLEDALFERWPVLRLSVAMSFPHSRFDTITSIFDDDKIRALWAGQGWPAARVARHTRMACTASDLPGPAAPRSRAELGLAAEALVIVTVGNRLHAEIDAAFAAIMFAHLERHPHSLWLLVGAARFPLPELADHPMTARCRCLPYETDLNGLYRLCDLYANPDRAGGGLSAFWAMAEGVPVLTLDTLSDAAMCVPQPWRMRDAAHYAATLDELAADGDRRRALGAAMAEAARGFAAPETFVAEFRRVAALTLARFNERVRVIPVARPCLPPTVALLPYLEEIERNRWYANHGPLARRLEARLAARFGVPEGGMATAGSGTAALTAALLALRARRGGLCLMPSWSFVATAHAAVAAGLVPCFVDVDPLSWALTPELAGRAVEMAAGPVSAVVPVMPFGAPVEVAGWDRFTGETGVPVVIDGAAGFDALRPGRTPVAVSLHATKALGAGEGGFVVSTDTALIRAVEDAANFGFVRRREAEGPGLNGKMSEYHAAVALAALDRWADTRAALSRVAGRLGERLRGVPGVTRVMGFGDGWVSAACVVELASPLAGAVAEALGERGIDTRAWWWRGIHAQAAFRDHPRGPLPVTERLAASTLGLPFHGGLTDVEIDRIVTALAESRGEA